MHKERFMSRWVGGVAAVVAVGLVSVAIIRVEQGVPTPAIKTAKCADSPCQTGALTDAVFEKAGIRSVEDVRQFEKAGIKSEKGVEAFADRTKPSKPLGNTPSGQPKRLTGNSENQRAIMRENETADKIAAKGYDVKRLPDVNPGGNGYGQPGSGSNPDYLIEGRVFDNYAPSSDNLDTIRGKISDKVPRQAERIVLTMDDTPVTKNDIINILQRKPVQELKEVIVLKGDELTHIFPF